MVGLITVEEKIRVVKETWSTGRLIDELFLELDNAKEIDEKGGISKRKYSNDTNSITKYGALHTIFNLYKLDRIPNQGIVIVYHGTRPANDLGFIYKYRNL